MKTYIEANQYFVLGEGKRCNYKTKIINKGKIDVKVFGLSENEERKLLGVSKSKEKNEDKVAEDILVIFKNLGSKIAVIGHSLSCETNLSIGYRKN